MSQPSSLKFTLAALAICCSLAGHVVAQSDKASEPIVLGGAVGIDGTDCEHTQAFLHSIASAAGEDKSIIMIGRLGKREYSRRLSRYRLDVLRDYLSTVGAVPGQRIITAEGERVSGLGRVEVYVGGKLFMIFTVKRNKDFAKGCSTA